MHRLPVGKRTRLAELERTMELAERHVTCWLESLQAIRDEGLFHDQYETFEEYCEKRWGKTRRRIDQLIAHTAIVAELKTELGGDLRTRVLKNGQEQSEIPLPENEKQTRPLAALPEEERGDAWEAAVELANGKQPTAGQVREVVETKKAETNGDTVDQTGQIVDAEGKAVPGPALPAFDAAKEIGATCKRIDGLTKEIADKRGQPGWEMVLLDSVTQALKNARQTLYQSRATHVCPYCKGAGKKRGETCNACKGRGWTIKSTYNAAPDELKAS